MIRIVIVDDHAIVRAGLKQMFAIMPDMEVVAEAVDGESALDTLRVTRCDILLLDINMPGCSGPDLITRVKAHWPSQPILVLSMHDTAQVASRALKAGADGYVTKDSEPEVLLAAIRKIAAGGRFISGEVAQKMALMATASGPLLPHIPEGHPKLLHLWPPKLLQAGRSDYGVWGRCLGWLFRLISPCWCFKNQWAPVLPVGQRPP